MEKYTNNGVTYFRLHISCPVCKGNGIETPQSDWSHSLDGGDIYVGDDATYQCKQCGRTQHVSVWQYGCPSHSGDSDEYVYKKATTATLAAVMACAGLIVTAAGLPWLQKFMDNLENGWRD